MTFQEEHCPLLDIFIGDFQSLIFESMTDKSLYTLQHEGLFSFAVVINVDISSNIYTICIAIKQT